MKPNLIIGGVRKAGTTSLFHYLSQHPQVGPCRVKEPSFFTPLKYGRDPGPLAEYVDLFAHCQGRAYLMEASPGYFSGGARIADPIARTLEQPHVVVILRNPVDAFSSNFNFLRSRLRIDFDTTIEEYLNRCEALHAQEADMLFEHRDYNSIHSGMYAQFLPAWVDAVGARFKVLFFEDLLADPRAMVAALCEWLGISPLPAEGFDYSVENKTEQYRIRWLQKLAVVVNRRCHSSFLRFHFLKKGLRKAYYLVNRNARGNRPMLAACRSRLDVIFREPNRRLAAQLLELGYDRLPSWLAASVPPDPPRESGKFRVGPPAS